MRSKNILLYEKYDGVRFVLERSLSKFEGELDIFSSHLKTDVIERIQENKADLLITELSKHKSDGIEISVYARNHLPNLKILWITVLGCHAFRQLSEELGNVKCIEKPLEIKKIRQTILKSIGFMQ